LDDLPVEHKPWFRALSELDVGEARDAPDGNILRRIGASIPQAWRPVARRGLSGVAGHLPAGMRYRLSRLLGLMGPDMGTIERDYPAWIDLYDRVDADTRRGVMAEIARITHPPLLSVLMPVFNPSPRHLLAAIHSVRDQFYPWWELCIGDDASTDPAVIETLRDAAATDHRIKLVRRERNGHISAASNSALTVATGSFVVLLDHDDVLPPHALHEVAARIAAQPNVDIIYSDEDHIDDEGHRSHPYFKPDWNPELILGQNLISHLGVYRRSLVEQIGGFRGGFEGSQDYDLALRIVAETRADRIAHIPKVLYHWRQGAADPSFSEAAHDRCVDSGRRAVLEFVTREQPDARVEPAPVVPGWTRVVYPLPDAPPLVSVIVSGNGAADALSACLDGLLNRTAYPALEVLLLAGEDGARGAVTLPDRLARDERVRRFARGHVSVNAAAEEARGSLLLMLDPDVEPRDAGWLREMVSHAVRPGVGAVGAKLLGSDGTVRHAGLAVGGNGVAFAPFSGRPGGRAGYFGHLQLARDVTAASLLCLLADRQGFLAAGGVDEALSPAGFSGLDLCLRVADIGCRIVWTPYAELTLRKGLPREGGLAPGLEREAALMRQRWGHRLNVDPHWSPNLSCDPEEMALAFPPRSGKFRLLQSPGPTRRGGPRAIGTAVSVES
jgi:GT2 family glycosyltransferase